MRPPAPSAHRCQSRRSAPRRLVCRRRVGRRPDPLTAMSGAPWWSVALTAITGAWIGHFLEYVRVAGWHTATSEMTSSVHLYFFPAGVALVAALSGCALLARRAWTRLGRRLRAAEMGLRRPPSDPVQAPSARLPRKVSVVSLWAVLIALQLLIWTVQENLEAGAAGHPLPLWAVLGGVHWLAPVVQAEVALILAVIYGLGQGYFRQRHGQVVVLETIVARRWRHRPVSCRRPVEPGVLWAPVDRWGAQRWSRPPPVGASDARTSG